MVVERLVGVEVVVPAVESGDELAEMVGAEVVVVVVSRQRQRKQWRW